MSKKKVNAVKQFNQEIDKIEQQLSKLHKTADASDDLQEVDYDLVKAAILILRRCRIDDDYVVLKVRECQIVQHPMAVA